MPKVSLIIPVYNVALYIERCIISIINQTFSDYEAIFVNDGSTDNSAEICQRLIAPYQNMKMINKKNGGLSSARLCGFHKAEGEYICFIDSDDYLAPTYLQTLYDAITTNDADVSMCGYFTDNGKEQVVQKLYFKEQVTIIDKDKIMEEYLLPQISSIDPKDKRLPSFLWLRMFKKSLLTEGVFVNEKEVCFEDLAFSLVIYRHISKIVLVNVPCYYYSINYGSLTLSHRDNAWNMMCTLYNLLVKNLGSDNSCQIDKRINGFVFGAVLFALRNSAIKGFDHFIQTVRQITSYAFVKDALGNTSIRKLYKQHLILAICYHTSTILLLYFYYKRKTIQ